MIKILLNIFKKMMMGFLGFTLLIVVSGFIFMNTSPQFGGKLADNDLLRIKNSPNFHNNSFQNIEKTSQNTGLKISTLLKFFTNGDNKTPLQELPQNNLNTEYFENKPSQPRITWFGHSAVFVEIENTNIFIDPMLGDVPAPNPLLGSKRFNKNLPISIDSLPEIDVVLISHDHYDHLDYGSIIKLNKKVKKFYVPLGIKAHLTKWGG